MALNIPMTLDSGAAFTQGIATSANMMAPIMQRALAQRQLMQLAKFEQDRVGYQNASLALQQLNSNREADVAKAQENLIAQQILASKMKTDPDAMVRFISGLYQNPTFQKMYSDQTPAQQNIVGALSGGNPMRGGGALSGAISASQNLPQSQPPFSSNPGMPQALQTGGIYNGPNPAAQAAMKFAGLPVIETPQQKEQMAINEQSQKDQNAANQKRVATIQQTAESLYPLARDVATMQDILKRKPNLTGKMTAALHAMGLTSDTDVGRFAGSSLDVQSFKAHGLSRNGGYGVSRIVAANKPDIGSSGAFNKGALDQLQNQLKDSFDLMEQDHMKLTGQHLPYNYQQFFTNAGKVWNYNRAKGKLE